MRTLAVIAARGGSKGLPGKNIAECGGKALITWTIEAALKASRIEQLVVSTDSEVIREIARAAGVKVPWLRPPELSGDDAGIEAVIRHAIQNTSGNFELVCSLQPTSPLRSADHIDSAIDEFIQHRKNEGETLVSVVEAPSKTRWLLEEDDQGYISMPLLKTGQDLRRQKLPACYFPNGAIYLAPTTPFNGFYGNRTRAFLMDKNCSIDVDSLEDLEVASALLGARK